MLLDKIIKITFCCKVSVLLNFLFGVVMLGVILVGGLPDNTTDWSFNIIFSWCCFIATAFIPVLLYNAIRYKFMIMSCVDYGILEYILTLFIPYIIPIIMYIIAWLNGFRLYNGYRFL